jgi:predicted dehydrogenase
VSVRIGVLGAARIAPAAVIRPAAGLVDAEVVAVAARQQDRARRFADRHKVPRAYGCYPELLADPAVDAVYIAVPNGLHGRWSLAALEAGKHVLCEKPFTANAEEAATVVEAGRRSGLVVMEAFHYRYHALAARMLQIVNSGELGEVQRLEAWLGIPMVGGSDIRWNAELAGGALMDTGCYAIHLVRTLAQAEPTVVSATARVRKPGVDRLLRAELQFPDGRTGSITAFLLDRHVVSSGARVLGTAGSMRVLNPFMPQLGHLIRVRCNGTRVEVVPRRPTSYAGQLQAFTDAVLHGGPPLTGGDDAIANMAVIDACYEAAGLARREPTR